MNGTKKGGAIGIGTACVITALAAWGAATTARAATCVSSLECNDFNACTTDSCDNGTCNHTAVAAGAPCGSDIDDDCTDPDTCLAGGICWSNDAANGTQCTRSNGAHGLCRAGVCGFVIFKPKPLPDGGYVSSIPTDLLTFHYGPSGAAAVGDPPTGRKTSLKLMDSGGLYKAAIAQTLDNGDTWQLQALPTPPLSPSVANTITATTCASGTQTFVAAGSMLSPEMPTAWSCDVTGCDTLSPVMSPWSAEPAPMPIGATTGIVMDGEYESTNDEIVAVGFVVDGSGFNKAILWTRSAAGTWSFAGLPDNGAGSNAEARAVMVVPDGGALAGQIVIVGGSDDPGGNMMPTVWVETGVGTGVFNRELPTMPNGVATGKFTGTTIGDLGIGIAGGATRFFLMAGTVELYDGKTAGIISRTSDFVSWQTVGYASLPGYGNGWDQILHATNGQTPGLVVVSGTSYNTDLLTDGVATDWRFINAPDSLMYDRTIDVNALAFADAGGIDAGSRIVSRFGGTTTGDLGSEFTVGTVVEDATATAAGTPVSHAYGFEGLNADAIPATSTWGIAVLALLLLCAATLTIVRMRRHRTASTA